MHVSLSDSGVENILGVYALADREGDRRILEGKMRPVIAKLKRAPISHEIALRALNATLKIRNMLLRWRSPLPDPVRGLLILGFLSHASSILRNTRAVIFPQ